MHALVHTTYGSHITITTRFGVCASLSVCLSVCTDAEPQSLRSKRRLNSKQIMSLDDGEDIYRAMHQVSDPQSFQVMYVNIHSDCAVTPQCAVPSLNARLGLCIAVVYVSCLLLFADTTIPFSLSLSNATLACRSVCL